MVMSDVRISDIMNYFWFQPNESTAYKTPLPKMQVEHDLYCRSLEIDTVASNILFIK